MLEENTFSLSHIHILIYSMMKDFTFSFSLLSMPSIGKFGKNNQACSTQFHASSSWESFQQGIRVPLLFQGLCSMGACCSGSVTHVPRRQACLTRPSVSRLMWLSQLSHIVQIDFYLGILKNPHILKKPTLPQT